MSHKTDSQQNNPDRKIITVVGLVFVGALIANFVSLDFLAQSPPLIPDTPEVERVDSAREIAERGQLPFYQPTDLMGAEGVDFATFTQPYRSFPRGAAIGMYAKNNWRLFQIEQYPNQTVEALLKRISFEEKQDVQISSGTAILLYMDTPRSCFEPTDTTVGYCPVNRVLLIQKPGIVVTLSTGNADLTDGQLIQLGRSLKKIHQ